MTPVQKQDLLSDLQSLENEVRQTLRECSWLERDFDTYNYIIRLTDIVRKVLISETPT